MCNSNVWPNAAPLQEIRLRNLSDLDFDLSMSLKIKWMVSLDTPYMIPY